MLKKSLLSLTALAAIATLCLTTGCESSGSKSSDANVVGSWKVTNFVDPLSGRDDVHTGFYWNFRSDGTFSLDSAPGWQGRRPGTYSVSGNKVTGSATNPGVGKYNIKFTVNGKNLEGDFIEHWGPNKTIKIKATKQ